MHVPIRAGSDIAFLGGLIRHVLETESYFKEYVVNYTNAATLINEDFQDTEELGGFFCGFDADRRHLRPAEWSYEGGAIASSAGKREHSAQSFEARTGAGMMTGRVKTDPTLQDPRCVINVLRKHFARYTPEMVERITRHRPGDPARGRRDADRQLGPRAHDRALLRRRLDAAHGRRADDPRRRDPPAAARQHRPPRRRRPRAARPRDDPGQHRHPDALRPAARLPAHAARTRGRADAEGVRRHRRRGQGLVVELRQVHRLPAQGLVRRRGDQRERLRLQIPAEDHRQPLPLPDDAARPRRRPRRHLPDGPEPRRRLDARRPDAPRAGDHEVGRGARPTGDRVGELLARGPRGPRRRAEDRGHPDRGLPDARGEPRGEGRLVHADPAARAVARQGTRPARRRPQRPVVHLPPLQARPGALRGLDRRQGLADPEPHLGLRRGRAGRRAGPEGDQRLHGRRRQARARLRAAVQRRQHGLRLLDLQRRLRRRRQPGRRTKSRATSPSPAARSPPSGAGPGRPTAASSTRARPPTPRASRGPSARSTSGGTARSGRATTSRTSRSTSRRTTARPTTPRAWTRSTATRRS